MINFRLPTALFGGSFDPVHEGHLHVAREVRAAIPTIKQIIFVPAFQSPGKHAAGATGEQRLRWLKLATQNEVGFGVWDIELERRGESFTVHTLESAHKQGAAFERLYWIMGADAYATFESWREPARIRELCSLVVVSRPGKALRAQHTADILLPIPPHPASSTEIRAQLASGETTSPWLPAVLRAEMEKILPLQNPYVRKR